MVIDVVQFELVVLFMFLLLSIYFSDKYALYGQKKYRTAGIFSLVLGIVIFFGGAVLSGAI